MQQSFGSPEIAFTACSSCSYDFSGANQNAVVEGVTLYLIGQ